MSEQKRTEEEEKLLADVKNYNDILMSDDDTDEKLWGIIQRGKSMLNDIAGKELDYNLEEAPRGLLFDYVRYARSGVVELFKKNFQSELVQLEIESEVEDYAKSIEAGSEI